MTRELTQGASSLSHLCQVVWLEYTTQKDVNEQLWGATPTEQSSSLFKSSDGMWNQKQITSALNMH